MLDKVFLNGNMSTIIVHLSEHLNTAINLRSLAFQSEVEGVKKWSLIKWWKAPGTVRFDARPVLPDSDRSWVPDVQNVRIAALNGDSLGHIPKLPESEDPYGSRFRYHLMKKHFWASGIAKWLNIKENKRFWPFEQCQKRFWQLILVVALSTIQPEFWALCDHTQFVLAKISWVSVSSVFTRKPS